jgi:hypothetical protein
MFYVKVLEIFSPMKASWRRRFGFESPDKIWLSIIGFL